VVGCGDQGWIVVLLFTHVHNVDRLSFSGNNVSEWLHEGRQMEFIREEQGKHIPHPKDHSSYVPLRSDPPLLGFQYPSDQEPIHGVGALVNALGSSLSLK